MHCSKDLNEFADSLAEEIKLSENNGGVEIEFPGEIHVGVDVFFCTFILLHV